MTITPAHAAGVSLGVAAIAGGVGLTAGTLAGLVLTTGDGSVHYGSRNGFSHKVDARSREAALDKVDGERDTAKVTAVIGGVLSGVGLLMPGYYRAGMLLTGGAFLGVGAGMLFQLRNAEGKVEHLPSEAELPPVSTKPWRPEITMPGGSTTSPTPSRPFGDAGSLPSLAERLAAAQAEVAAAG